jgi:flagellar motor switch protein FliN/FliY
MVDEEQDLTQAPEESASVQDVSLEDQAPLLDSKESDSSKLDIDFLNNVPMTVTVELGVGNITIKDLLQLGEGSVLELNKLAGEPLEVKLNDRLVSKGEVVVLNEKYGIRLTDVINPDEKVD